MVSLSNSMMLVLADGTPPAHTDTATTATTATTQQPANGAAAQGPMGCGQGGITSFAPLILIFAVFYFMLIRPQQKKQKETEAMRSSIKKGDRVLTTGGLYGTVVGEREGIVVLKVADDVKMEFSREAIIQVKERSG